MSDEQSKVCPFVYGPHAHAAENKYVWEICACLKERCEFWLPKTSVAAQSIRAVNGSCILFAAAATTVSRAASEIQLLREKT